MKRAVLPVIGLASLLTPLAAVGLLCWLILLTPWMPGRTRARQAAAAAVVVFACNAACLSVLALIHVPCNPRVLVGSLLVVGIALRLRLPEPPGKPLVDADDCLALGLGAVTFIALVAPLVGASIGKTMSLISQTTDGATHVGIVRAIAEEHGYLQFHHPPGLSPGAHHYPSGWHGNVWITGELLFGSRLSVGELVRLVSVAAFAHYALLSALTGSVALRLRSNAAISARRSALITVLVVALSTVIGFGLYFVQLSSFTQVSALVAVLVLMSAALDDATRWSSVVLAAACSVAVMQSWYLLAPLALAPALVLLRRARPPRSLLLLAGAVTVLLGSYPVLTGPRSTQVNEPGATLLPTIGGVVGLLVATGAGCALVLRGAKHHRDGARAVAGATVASLVTMVALIGKQGFVAGTGVTYYGAKVLLATFLLGTVVASAAAPAALTMHPTRQGAAALACVVGVASCTWSTSRWTLPPRSAVQFGNLVPATLDAMVTRHPHGLPMATEVLVGDSCDRVADEITSKWPYDTGLSWNEGISRALDEYANSRRGDESMIEERLRDPHVRTFEVYVHHECDPKLLSDLSGNPKVRLIRVP